VNESDKGPDPAMIEAIIKGRLEQDERVSEVMETVVKHHGPHFELAARTSLEMNSIVLELIKVVHLFAPAPLDNLLIDRIIGMMGVVEAALMSLAAMASKPGGSVKEYADACVEVNKLISPLQCAMVEQRVKEQTAFNQGGGNAPTH
jgi:hypothetical protein